MTIIGNRTKAVGLVAAASGTYTAVTGDTSSYENIASMGSNIGLVLLGLGAGFYFLRSAIDSAVAQIRRDLKLYLVKETPK